MLRMEKKRIKELWPGVVKNWAENRFTIEYPLIYESHSDNRISRTAGVLTCPGEKKRVWSVTGGSGKHVRAEAVY